MGKPIWQNHIRSTYFSPKVISHIKDTGLHHFPDGNVIPNLNAIEPGSTTKKFFELRGYTPDIFDGVSTDNYSSPAWFYANPWYCALIGNDKISGPTISQACATSATAIYTAVAV